jgi:hypothetical protein
VRRAISSVTSACQRSTRSTWCCRIRGTRFAVSPPAWIRRPFGLSPARVRPLRWCSRHNRLRPHEDGDQTACRPAVGGAAHPEAAAFADHYGFSIDVLAAYRRAGKVRVERQVRILRDHSSTAAASTRSRSWTARLPSGCRSAGPRPIALAGRSSVRAGGRAALLPLPVQPYLVTEKHLRPGRQGLSGQFRSFQLLAAGPPSAGGAAGSATHPA